ncbi:ComEC/Rec2 family competence protein [Palleronia rufa]
MVRARVAAWFDTQRGGLFLWSPVCLAVGIGLYFALPVEPDPTAWAVLATALAAGGAAMAAGFWRWPLLVAVMLVGAGLGLAGVRSALVAGPVLDFRYYGAVEGRVVEVDRSGSDKPRMTLDRVVLERTPPDRTPRRVRISLHGDQRWLSPAPGNVVIVTAHLSGPEGPVEPGGFDFQRMAWFEGLGAVGYARTPALLLEPSGRGLPVARLRAHMTAAIVAALPGDAGAFAAAITTGDRSSIETATLDALRASNLAHLLAISGLHMGLLTGLVFGALRVILALFPASVGWPAKSIAAMGALAAGAAYLALSGGNVATQRAFIMAAVMLVAVLVGRRAMTLRAVAIAALIVLVLRPDALTGPGFQMSFAATTALVVAFRFIRDRGTGPRGAVLTWAFALFVSSAVAGAATAPVGAAQFNQLSPYGLVANLVSVPVMGLTIMPAALLAAVLAPLGLAWIGLALMEPGIRWILLVATRVAALDGATVPVPSPPPFTLALLALGALWLILWHGRVRWIGAAPVLAAFAMWSAVERPTVLVAPSAALVGIMGPEGRALSKPRGAGFAARVWLENDGDPTDQPAAAERPGWDQATGQARTDLGGTVLWHVYGRGGIERAQALCTSGNVVVSSQPVPQPGDCLMLDPRTLEKTGSVAIYAGGEGLRIVTARERAGLRPWNGADRQRDRRIARADQ